MLQSTKQIMDSLRSNPFTMNSLLSAGIVQALFYLCLVFPTLYWNFSDTNYPVPLHQSAIFQLCNEQGAIETFSIMRGTNRSPIPISHKLQTPFFPSGAHPTKCSDMLIIGSGDECYNGSLGMSSFSMTQTIIVAIEDASPVGIQFGGTQENPLMSSLGNTFAAASVACLVFSILNVALVAFILSKKETIEHDDQRRYLVTFSILQKTAIGALVLRVILLVSGTNNGHTMAILISIFLVENLSRLMCAVLCDMTMSNKIQGRTQENGIAIILLSKVCGLVFIMVRFILVLVVLFQVNNWFISVPDMSPFDEVYYEGVGTMAVCLVSFYMVAGLALEIWASNKNTEVIQKLVDNRVKINKQNDYTFVTSLDMSSFVLGVLFETTINVIAFLCVFLYLSRPRFTD